MTGYFSKPPPGIQIDYSHPLIANMAALWIFNEGSGLRLNNMLNTVTGNTGTLINFEPMSSSQGWYGSQQGTSLLFNATNSTYVTIPFMALANLSQYTVEVWFQTTGTGIVMFSESSTINNVPLIWIQVVSNKFVFEQRSSAGTDMAISSTTTANDGKLYHGVSVKKASNSWLLYLNGKQEATSSTSLGTTSTNNNRIGIAERLAGFAGQFTGTISMIRVWKNRVLTSEEIQTLYSKPFEMFKYLPSTITKIASTL